MATDENSHGDAQAEQAPPPESQSVPNAGAEANVGAAEAPDAGAKLAEREAELAREREAAADYLRRWHQAQADLANYKRRAQQEQEQHVRLATGRALALVLPALDSFERAFATLPPSLRGLSWISGLALVEMQLQSALAASGATEVPAEPGAAFNPQYHEAVGEVETAEHPAGHIAAVLQRGYAIEGLLIRPALVQLARAPQPQATEASQVTAGEAVGAASGASRESEEASPEPSAPAGKDTESEGGGDNDNERQA